MRITCDACKAQYNLPDEKVRGRRVKVRCKRCSEGIIVDGTQLVAGPAPSDFEDEATRVMDSPLAGGNMWTVNLSEDEQGDMTDEELLAGWQAGIVTEDAYVWREGMDDWAAVLDVPELASMLATVPRPTPAAAPAVVEAPAASPSPEPAPLAAPAAQPAPRPQAGPTDLFGPDAFGDSAPSSTRGGAASLPTPPPLGVAPAAPKAPSPFDDLFGEPKPPARRDKPKAAAATAREENSVLFSLDALKQAAAPENIPAAPGAPSVRTAVLGGRASEDILTMGGPTIGGFDQAPLIEVDAPPPAPVPAVVASSMPPAAAAGSTTPPAPVKSRAGMFAVIALTALVAGGGAIAATQLFGGDDDKTAANDAPARQGEVEDDGKKSDDKKDSEDKDSDDKKDSEDKDSDDKKDSEDKDSDDKKDSDGKDSDDKKDSDGKSTSSGSKSAGNTASKTPSKSSGSTSSGSTSSGSTSSGSKSSGSDKDDSSKDTNKVEPAEVDLGGGGSEFSTAAAKASLSAAAANAKSCASPGGPSGKGKVQVTFVPSGRVTSANVVAGPFGGTPVGGCVARTFRSARVPKFSGAPVTVAKSFTIPSQ